MEQSAASPSKPLWPKLLAVLVIAAIAIAGYFSFFAKPAAPQFSLVDLQGQQVGSQRFQGKVVMVNFWATSCTTCVKEMPRMVDTYNQFRGRGLEFVAVAMSYDPPNYVLNYAQTRSLPFHVAIDVQGQAAKAFGDVQMTPTTFVIGKDGRILKRYLGEPDWDGLKQLLDKALT